MANVEHKDDFERLEKMLAIHRKRITEMMLRTENLEAAIQLARQKRAEGDRCVDSGDIPPIAP